MKDPLTNVPYPFSYGMFVRRLVDFPFVPVGRGLPGKQGEPH